MSAEKPSETNAATRRNHRQNRPHRDRREFFCSSAKPHGLLCPLSVEFKSRRLFLLPLNKNGTVPAFGPAPLFSFYIFRISNRRG